MSDASPEQSPETGPIETGAPRGRPARTYTTGTVTRVLRWVAVGVMVLTIAAALLSYPSLPEEVPVHFGLSGEPDAWGPKSSIFLLVGIGAAVVFGVAWLSAHPAWFNYPSTVTRENAQEHYRNGEQMMVWLLLCLAVLFSGILFSSLAPITVGWLIAAAGGGIFVSLGVGVARMFRIPEAVRA
ncbi:DUF1648 domain-containing protein [Leucobacter chromiireducens]|uniref:DUF1648 domain-containing protein n=1 Tax=Leucobacter chromiireducens TaxID=283877 RepID=UPI000F62C956|nr:DUF1648 domain-containing protein [Leucobacter chromiireducens]